MSSSEERLTGSIMAILRCFADGNCCGALLISVPFHKFPGARPGTRICESHSDEYTKMRTAGFVLVCSFLSED